jgi:hypothetical protein
MAGPINQWNSLFFDSMQLGFDASCVVALRMAKIACGGTAAHAETHAMFDEKLRAVIAANVVATKSLLRGQAHLAPKRAMRVYQSKVRKNLRRLAK